MYEATRATSGVTTPDQAATCLENLVRPKRLMHRDHGARCGEWQGHTENRALNSASVRLSYTKTVSNSSYSEHKASGDRRQKEQELIQVWSEWTWRMSPGLRADTTP
jgi:hypothetical protein